MNDYPRVYCPNCKNCFSEEQTIMFFNGIFILCEQCGLGFKRYIGSTKAKNVQHRNLADQNKPFSKLGNFIRRIFSKTVCLIKKIFTPPQPEKIERTNQQASTREHNYDPFTGLPLEQGKNKCNDPHNRVILSEELIEKIFSVLSPTIRKRLQDLSLDQSERVLMAKSFIYFTEDQQNKYLTELELLNRSEEERKKHEKEIDELISIIRNIPAPKNQQDYLIEQLKYLPGNEKKDFAKFLKNSSKR